VQKDRVDQSALGFDHSEKLAQHESQKGPPICVVCMQLSRCDRCANSAFSIERVA